MLITKLRQSKRASLVQVFVDEDFLATINKNTLVKYGLYKGFNLSKELWEEIKKVDIETRLYNLALKQIASRPRSQNEMFYYLKRKADKIVEGKEPTEKMIANVIDKLISNNYINDAEFAKWLIDNRLAFKGKSRKELQGELYSKGIPREVAETALLEVNFVDAEYEIIKKLALKRYHTEILPTDKNQLQKLLNYFMRRGFSYSQIKSALSQDNN